jgi:serine/threonine-protein kinase RsbT
MPVANAVNPRGHAGGELPGANELTGGDAICVFVKSPTDILEARKKGRELAAEMGFSSTDCTLVATAISELARNIVIYAREGLIRIGSLENTNNVGVIIIASDEGPGIEDLRSAMRDGFSTSHGLGLGLPGVKRIMDEFEIVSKPKQGTTVTIKKWRPR